MKKYHYYIWQRPLKDRKCFRFPIDYNEVDLRDYVLVYFFETDTSLRLDEIYDLFNDNIPEDYHARSLSISDLIMIRINGVPKDECHKFYVVDIQGFKRVELEESSCKMIR